MKRYSTVVELFDQSCQRFAANTAFSALGHSLSFAELDRLAHDFAVYLQGLPGLEPGDRIAVQLPNLLQYPVAVFGALRAGLVVVNTNPLYTERELEYQLCDAGAKALVVLENFAAKAAKVLPDTQVKHVITTQVADLHPPLRRLLLNAAVKYLKRAVPAFRFPHAVTLRQALQLGSQGQLTPVSRAAEDIAMLQYTGGTTGVAKGAMLTHANLTANAWQVCTQLPDLFREQSSIFCAPLPLYHVYALTVHLFCGLCSGNHSVLIPNPRDISTIVKAFKQYPITGFVGLNTLYNALLANTQFRQLDLSTLNLCSAGGMALTQDTAKRWQELTGLEVLEGYGLTETSPVVSSNITGKVRLGTIGVPVPETEVKVIDEEGKELPTGEPGELCVRGPQVMKGYWNRPDETAKVMTEDGFFRTGDIATIDAEGYIRIVDRLKDMISVSGLKVFPNEVEDVATLHPQVKEAAAIGVPDEHSGEVVKLFAVRTDESLSEQELRSFCRERLAAYKVPKHIVFRADLPKSNVGKILRRELKDEEQGG